MSAFKTFFQQNTVGEKLYGAITDFLKKDMKLAIEPLAPTLMASPQPLPFQNLAQLRINGGGRTGVIPFGFVDKATEALVDSLAPAFRADPAIKNSPTLGSCIAKAAGDALQPFLQTLEAQMVIPVSGEALLGWKRFDFTEALLLPFKCKGAEIRFYVPIVEGAKHTELTRAICGLPETATILVADDSPVMIKMARQVLNTYGFLNVIECPDGAKAAEQFEKNVKIDLILSDWHMPNMSGIQLLQLVRSKPELKNTPVIMVTGERNKTEVISAIQSGVSGYVVKPFDGKIIMEAIKKAFSAAPAATAAAKKAA